VWGHHFGEPSKWIEAVWGGEEKGYTLATARIWGTHIVASDLITRWHWMSHLENLSIRHKRSAFDRPFTIDSLFPFLNSLTIRMPTLARPFEISQPLHHPHLRYLYLSGLSFDQSMLSRSLDGLPRLEELLLHNWLCKHSGSPFHHFSNTSIKRLIVSLAILSAWREATLTNLEYLKVVLDDPSPLSDVETYDAAMSAGDVLVRLNSQNLTLDLTSARMEAGHVFALLSRLSSLRSLWVESLQPLLSEEETEEMKMEIGEIVCASSSPLPFPVVVTPLDGVLPSSGGNLTLYVPGEQQCRALRGVDSHQCFLRGLPFHFVRIPQWRIEAMLYDQFAIQHHEYQEVM
jgi:hypothetical protein